MNPTEQTITQIVAEVAAALKSAAVEYGPEAAELALMAYRVDAIKTLLFIPLAALAVWGLWQAWRLWLRISEPWVEKYGDGSADTSPRTAARIAGGIVGSVLAAVFVVPAAFRLIEVPLWLAAFGNPEILIATRALQAAGLM